MTTQPDTESLYEQRQMLMDRISDAIDNAGCCCDANQTCPPHDALETLVAITPELVEREIR